MPRQMENVTNLRTGEVMLRKLKNDRASVGARGGESGRGGTIRRRAEPLGDGVSRGRLCP